MKCPFCSREINDAALFCGFCGKQIPQTPIEVSPQPPPIEELKEEVIEENHPTETIPQSRQTVINTAINLENFFIYVSPLKKLQKFKKAKIAL